MKLAGWVLLVAAAPLCASAQEPNTGQLRSEAQRVVKIISGDKAKLQTYCEIMNLSDQADDASNSGERARAEELSKRADELTQQLGPDYAALMEGLQTVDPMSPAGLEISTTLAALDKLCH